MTKINVVCGGQSSEREVSLRSGNAVANALRQIGYDVRVLDTSDNDETMANCEVVFPVLHGIGGEDGEFQARLEKLGVTFVGTDATGSKLCMDKSAYRAFMIERGFLMPQGVTVDETSYFSHPLSRQAHVLKPVDGGSSVDTYIFRDPNLRDEEKLRDSFARNNEMILEELITGTEVTVGILGDKPLPVIEIIPPAEGEFDFENKYNGLTQELTPPPHVTSDLQLKVQNTAFEAHIAAGCRDFSRSDFIITDKGDCYLLETNTIPGMTDQSLFPKAAAIAGFPMPKLVDILVGFALARGERNT